MPAIWLPEVRGIDFPACRHAHEVSPEQSNPVDGDVPPQRYGLPIWVIAAATADEPLPLGGDTGRGAEGVGAGEEVEPPDDEGAVVPDERLGAVVALDPADRAAGAA